MDEFQDINPLQFELLKSWLGADSTLVVVGDPDQAIYGWNGADPELITSLSDHFQGCAQISLNANFRSSPEILAAAGRVLGRPAQPACVRLIQSRPSPGVTATKNRRVGSRRPQPTATRRSLEGAGSAHTHQRATGVTAERSHSTKAYR